MSNKEMAFKLAKELREMNPGFKFTPVGDLITVDRADLLEVKWPLKWCFNGYDMAYIPGTETQVTIVGGFNPKEE